jgi:superfamily II DNA/RNA helicase
MDDFRIGKIQFLIASDIAARGLDIDGITHIFNLDIPEDPKGYLHRVGRTGRNGSAGVAVSIISGRELPLIRMYEKVLKINIAFKDMYKGKVIDAKKIKHTLPTK